MKRAFFLMFFLSSLASAALAQWKNVAPNILTVPAGSWGGVITYQGGNLWAGFDKIVFSPDLGKTWITRSPGSMFGSVVYDIAFYNNDIGVAIIAYPGNKVFLTLDQGRSWNDITPPSGAGGGSFVAACFAGSPTNIVVSTNDGSVCTTLDQGLTWKSAPLDICVFDVEAGNDGTVYAITGNLYISWDFGITWNKQIGTYDWDSYGFDRDRCDTNIFYVANDELLAPVDNFSSIYVSTNAGTSWDRKNSFQTSHYCGSVAATPGAIFAQTSSSVERSTNKGDTWEDIGGPPNTFDTRTLTAVSENIVFAVDNQGSIWATFNSGGDSLPVRVGDSLDISPRSLFVTDTVDCFSSISKTIVINRGACSSLLPNSCRLISSDSVSYSIDASALPDRIAVTFTTGTVPGSHQGLVIIALNDGTFDTVSLGGYCKSQPFSCSSTPASLFLKDTLYLCDVQPDTIDLHYIGCPLGITSQTITGLNATDYQFIKKANSPITAANDVVTIIFKPTTTGFRQGIYELVFENGDKISVPLSGFCAATKPLSIVSNDQATDTIGGPVHIPITITGLDKRQDIELVLHYEINPNIQYDGSYSILGAPLDIAGSTWGGRSKLRISGAMNNIVLGYANFTVFADSFSAPKIWFDSLIVITAVSNCEYSAQATAVSIISPPTGCGISIISRFMRTGVMPTFSIYPNPTSGNLTVESSQSLETEIMISDGLGRNCFETTLSFKKDEPATVNAGDLPSGVYLVRFKTNTLVTLRTLIIQR